MTKVLHFRIRPLNPLISRDSRPFGQGYGRRVRSLDWLTPSVVCGALRSAVGKAHGGRFDPEEIEKLNSIKVRGPFWECCGRLYFPRPLDFVTDKRLGKNGSIHGYAIRPQNGDAEEGGTEMPPGLSSSLRLAFLEGAPEDDFKPEPLPAFWSAEAIIRWLLPQGGESFSLNASECLPAPAKDERVHVSIDPLTGASAESRLFSTTGLDFILSRTRGEGADEKKEFLQTTVAIEAESPDDNYISGLSPLNVLGGERRVAEWQAVPDMYKAQGWSLPCMSGKSSELRRLRMILATPAIFSKGWLPGWIDEKTLEGEIPMSPSQKGKESVRVHLVSAVTGRWVPISGWSYEAGRHGAKPLRRMVPAGSVYFFEATKQIFDLCDLWLRSVCDNEQDRNDGFGIALWGTW
jgi:CRISPR-associated protein Cmr3